MKEREELSMIRQIKECFGFDFVGIATVLEAHQQFLTWMFATGSKNTDYRKIVLEPGKGVAGGVYSSGRPMVIQNTMGELSPRQQVDHPIIIAEELVSLLAIPLWKGARVAGVLMMAFRVKTEITKMLYEQVLQMIGKDFCGYEVQHARFEDAIHSGELDVPAVPIYELMRYQILQAKEEERKRLARDLHDTAIQSVVGAQYLLRSIKYANDRDGILAIADEVDQRLMQIQTDLRNISNGLRPRALDDLGLVFILSSFVKSKEENYGISIYFHENVGDTRYVPEIENVFYRVCQEAVVNACKYSGSADLMISLVDSGEYLTLEVTDHGIGFDLEHIEIKGGGMGLPNMRDQAALIDGEFTYQSLPGKGTSIWLTAPVKRRDPS